VNDQPTAEVLLRAVERFLEHDVVPRLDGVPKFHARVAANVVAMVARELELEDAQVSAEWDRLGALLHDRAACPAGREERRRGLLARSESLVQAIERGEADGGAFRTSVLEHLRLTVADKLAVARPPRQR
jgi:hypothetical protein